MSAFIDAYIPPDVDRVPWNWNPAETFLTAYTTMQEEKRAQEEFAIAQELDRYLLPMKKQQAELSLEKMNLEMEKTRGELTRQTLLTRIDAEAFRNTNKGMADGISAIGSGQTNEDPTSFNLTGTSYDRRPAAQSQAGSQSMARKPVVDLTGL